MILCKTTYLLNHRETKKTLTLKLFHLFQKEKAFQTLNIWMLFKMMNLQTWLYKIKKALKQLICKNLKIEKVMKFEKINQDVLSHL